jgi:hypothetical protein
MHEMNGLCDNLPPRTQPGICSMMSLLLSLGIVLVFVGITTLVIGLLRYFFPMVEDFIPQDFKQALSIRFAAYYLLAGLLLLLIQPAPPPT